MNKLKIQTAGAGRLHQGEAQAPPPNIVERTFRFAVQIVKLGVKLDEHPGVGRVLMPQIVRAGTAIGSQVEESQAAESTADFVSKLSVGLKESRETHYRLRVLAAAEILSEPLLPDLVLPAQVHGLWTEQHQIREPTPRTHWRRALAQERCLSIQRSPSFTVFRWAERPSSAAGLFRLARNHSYDWISISWLP